MPQNTAKFERRFRHDPCQPQLPCRMPRGLPPVTRGLKNTAMRSKTWRNPGCARTRTAVRRTVWVSHPAPAGGSWPPHRGNTHLRVEDAAMRCSATRPPPPRPKPDAVSRAQATLRTWRHLILVELFVVWPRGATSRGSLNGNSRDRYVYAATSRR